MTPADRVAQLEAQLELARADLESHVEALDREISRLKRQVLDLRAIIAAASALLDVREVPS